MKTLTSESLDTCLQYADYPKLTATDYGTYIRALVYTIQKELPVEIINNSQDIIKAKINYFTISFNEGEEGIKDSLAINYEVEDNKNLYTLRFDSIGIRNISKDKKSGSRSFYRYYINNSNEDNYRFTFNRRISKA